MTNSDTVEMLNECVTGENDNDEDFFSDIIFYIL